MTGSWLRPARLLLLGVILAGCGGPKPGTVLTLNAFEQIYLNHDTFKDVAERRAAGSRVGSDERVTIGRGSVLRIVSVEAGGAKVVIERAFHLERGTEQGTPNGELVGKTAWILDDELNYLLTKRAK